MNPHRFVRLNPHHRWCRVALALLVAAGSVSADESPPAEKTCPPDRFIHPLCLDELLASDGPAIVCDPELAETPVEETEPGAGRAPFISVRYPRIDGHYAGYIGYREVARWDGSNNASQFAVLEVTTSGGGTGHFSSLAKVKKTGGNGFEQLWRLHTGDRCNDGQASVIDVSEHQLTYSTSATPFRLLNPVDQSNWRMLSLAQRLQGSSGDATETLFGWEPYSDVANSAISCAGSIIHRYDAVSGETEAIGVTIDTDAFLAESQGTMQACINEWLRERMPGLNEGDEGWIPLEEWISGFESLRDLCLP